MVKDTKIRLFVDSKLGEGQSVSLNRDQANYLCAVMRLGVGDSLLLFNGTDGEWRAKIEAMNKRSGALRVQVQTADQKMPPDVWLVFAPIKKARTDFIVEKAAEMGAARILPVQTDYTNSDRIRQDRLQAHAVEAAEQCGGTYVPPVDDLQRLDHLLADWPGDRKIMFCNEGIVGQAGANIETMGAGKWAIIIGPEGGFSPKEVEKLRSFRNSAEVSLGPRILRADTAAVAALTLWQKSLGDWT